MDDLVGIWGRSGRRVALVGGAEYGLEVVFVDWDGALPLRASTERPRGCPRDWPLDHGDGDLPLSWSLFMVGQQRLVVLQRIRRRWRARGGRGRR